MTSTDSPDCLFCKIVAGNIPADVVASSDTAIAFRDIAPKAPVHVLVVPKEHYPDVAAFAASAPDELASVIALADGVAGELGDGQYRLIFNTGPKAGQTVFHVHAHLLAGGELPGFS
ncbi:histidine triad nucleotide-binding protein [Promicromonospora soli]